MRNHGPKSCLSFCIIFGRFTKITKNNIKNYQNILKNSAIFRWKLVKNGQFSQICLISPIFGYFGAKFRHRHLQKIHRHPTLEFRPFGEISPNLGTLVLYLFFVVQDPQCCCPARASATLKQYFSKVVVGGEKYVYISFVKIPESVKIRWKLYDCNSAKVCYGFCWH